MTKKILDAIMIAVGLGAMLAPFAMLYIVYHFVSKFW
jgi:hypothetical protein